MRGGGGSPHVGCVYSRARDHSCDQSFQRKEENSPLKEQFFRVSLQPSHFSTLPLSTPFSPSIFFPPLFLILGTFWLNKGSWQQWGRGGEHHCTWKGAWGFKWIASTQTGSRPTWRKARFLFGMAWLSLRISLFPFYPCFLQSKRQSPLECYFSYSSVAN